MATMKHARLLCVLALLACTGSDSTSAKNGGTLTISTGGDPDVLIPSLASVVQATQMTDMIYDRLADIGDSLNIVNDAGFKPHLADRWTWAPDSLSIAFHIDPRAKWHDGQRVTSSDVRFTFQSTMDSTLGSPVSALLANIDSVTTPDSATATFWFHRHIPQEFYDATYQMPIMPEHIWKGIAPSGLESLRCGKASDRIGPLQIRALDAPRVRRARRGYGQLLRRAEAESRRLEHRYGFYGSGDAIPVRRNGLLRGASPREHCRGCQTPGARDQIVPWLELPVRPIQPPRSSQPRATTSHLR